MAEFEQGICGCFNNCGFCLMSYFIPCYSVGKIAEAVDKSCLLYGCLALTPVRVCTGALLRQSVREKYGIDGGLLTDCLCHICCPLCATIQEGQEVISRGDAPPDALCMSRE